MGDYNAGMAVMNKKRVEANKIERMELVGTVNGCDCIIVDDMIDSAGTLCTAAQVLIDNGAKRVFACATHALLNGPGVKRIEDSVIEKVIVTNSVPRTKEKTHPKIIYVSVGRMLSEAIRRVHNEESISILF
jgi:ribose-phosphate pyrophosphokinase